MNPRKVPSDVRHHSQGIKSVDYFVDADGHVQFRRRPRSLSHANTWAAEDFKMVDNLDGTRTYVIATDDIHRGIDIVAVDRAAESRRRAGASGSSATSAMNLGLLGRAALVLPAAAGLGRRRQRSPVPES